MQSITSESIYPYLSKNRPVVFLDTARPESKEACSYLFIKPIQVLETRKFSEIPAILSRVDGLSKKFYLAGFISYEAGYIMESAFRDSLKVPKTSTFPLLWFGVYRKPYCFRHSKKNWQPPLPKIVKKGYSVSYPVKEEKIVLSPTLTYPAYRQRIKKIKSWIARGHTYQVNLTFDVKVRTRLQPLALYFHLREKQKTPYCACLDTGREQILSFSPEMFFKKAGSTIRVKPMKGTAPRGPSEDEDRKVKTALQQDLKNRAENLMIVDLLRNDLGRICRTGSVKTLRMFDVETHPTLHQMTSTVQGTLKAGTGYREIFRHIFPSGSVTGAPKIRTMEIIRELERGTRNVYCGAIGFIAPNKKAVFNVPIRTLQKTKREKQWVFRVGSGIVWDSKAGSEWAECMTKCRFLTKAGLPDFEIFESLLWNRRALYLRSHVQRFKRSARFFGFHLSQDKLDRLLRKINRIMASLGPQKVRIFLNERGGFRFDHAGLEEGGIPDSNRILLPRNPVDEKNIFLYHKTTHRPFYRKAMDLIRKGKCYDVVFTNSRREITEGARTNVFVKIRGRLYTPPVACGLLPGILRQTLLGQGKCRERILKVRDLKKADAIYCGNSVRGLVRVELE
jgi:para-aminobenzoate synthetase/4-amino-4-deoxychorismate lyase